MVLKRLQRFTYDLKLKFFSGSISSSFCNQGDSTLLYPVKIGLQILPFSSVPFHTSATLVYILMKPGTWTVGVFWHFCGTLISVSEFFSIGQTMPQMHVLPCSQPRLLSYPGLTTLQFYLLWPSLVSYPIQGWLHCSSTLSDLPSSWLNWLQKVQNDAAALTDRKRKSHHIIPVLKTNKQKNSILRPVSITK